MNILYLAHRIPFPPDKGDKIRAFRQIEHLSKRHNVWCACFVDCPQDLKHVPALEQYCQRVAAIPLNRTWATAFGLMGSALGSTVTESFYRSRAMRKTLLDWSSNIEFDAVVAFSSGMAPHALAVPAERRVLDLCDLDSHKWVDYAQASALPMRWVYRTEGVRLARRESAWIDAFDATTLITVAEAADLDHNASRDKVFVVGNGVNVSTLPPSWHVSQTPTVGFVGVMDYRPNVDAVEWFVTQCWERIRAAIPGAVFRIVGRSPTRRVQRLGDVPGVRVVGEVAEVDSYVERCDVSVAPMRIARGLQNKVLQAMALAKPVVLTPRAAAGISGRHGIEYVVAAESEAIAAATIQLLRDPAERRRIGLQAWQYVDRHHRWARELERFEFIVTGQSDASSMDRYHLKPTAVGMSGDQVEVAAV